jgi:NAD(P)-dependent dehydrogenase (short-subunit alcohol dehydrogenase family)
VLTVQGDVGDPATAEQVVGQGLEEFGRIDTLVNNAGIFISRPFTDYTAQDYANIIAVALRHRGDAPRRRRSERRPLR